LIGRLLETGVDHNLLARSSLEPFLRRMSDGNDSDRAVDACVSGVAAKLALARGDMTAARAGLDRAILEEASLARPTRLPEWLLLLAEIDAPSYSVHVREALEAWRRDYNEHRPHSKLGWMTPADYASTISGEPGRGAALRNGSAPRPLANTQNEDPNQPQTLVMTG
jgi:hypothetical protein